MNYYNNRKHSHSTIKMTPIDGSLKENEAIVFININRPLIIKNLQQFKLGDSVRINRSKGTFEKGYLLNWSEEIFTIDQIKNMILVTYILRDTTGVKLRC